MSAKRAAAKKPHRVNPPIDDEKPKRKRGAPVGNKNAVGNKGGAKPKLVADDKTLAEIEGLGKLQVTTKEAAGFLRVSEPTFLSFLSSQEKAREAFDQGKENGKISLRRAQLKAALAGNATMLVWMGKQLLGQKDKIEHAGDPDAPMKVVSMTVADFEAAARRVADEI